MVIPVAVFTPCSSISQFVFKCESSLNEHVPPIHFALQTADDGSQKFSVLELFYCLLLSSHEAFKIVDERIEHTVSVELNEVDLGDFIGFIHSLRPYHAFDAWTSLSLPLLVERCAGFAPYYSPTEGDKHSLLAGRVQTGKGKKFPNQID